MRSASAVNLKLRPFFSLSGDDGGNTSAPLRPSFQSSEYAASLTPRGVFVGGVRGELRARGCTFTMLLVNILCVRWRVRVGGDILWGWGGDWVEAEMGGRDRGRGC